MFTMSISPLCFLGKTWFWEGPGISPQTGSPFLLTSLSSFFGNIIAQRTFKKVHNHSTRATSYTIWCTYIASFLENPTVVCTNIHLQESWPCESGHVVHLSDRHQSWQLSSTPWPPGTAWDSLPPRGSLCTSAHYWEDEPHCTCSSHPYRESRVAHPLCSGVLLRSLCW